MGVPIYDFKVAPTPTAGGEGEGSTLVSLDVPLPFEQILFRTFFDPMRSFRNISMSPDKSATLYIYIYIYIYIFHIFSRNVLTYVINTKFLNKINHIELIDIIKIISL